MSVVRNQSAQEYMQRKKIKPPAGTSRPLYEMGTLHPHNEPVTPDPRLSAPDTPASKVKTS
jgi:hypothetical protein